jgi:AraC-like DNA-binding protein
VRRLIAEHLPSGDATLDVVAADLFYSRRKLQRLLHPHGTTFKELVNSIRRELALQYVQNKDMELIEIAFLLGFSEQSTFSRSFKRWTGTSPSEYRKAS